MKKLFLSLIFLPLCSYSADTDIREVVDAQTPVALNQDVPNAENIDPRKIIALVKKINESFLNNNGKSHQLNYHKATFPHVKKLLLKNNYIKSFGTQTEGLASLLACLFSTLTFKSNINISGASIEPSCCSCIPLEYRITQALFTVLLLKENSQSGNAETHINYVSLASGHLRQDYITLLALIKLGILNIHVALIDPAHNTLSKDISPYAVHPALSEKNHFQGQIAYFELRLKEIVEHYKQTTQSDKHADQHDLFNVTPYKSTEYYLDDIKSNPKTQPHVAILSDTAEERPMRTDIYLDFAKITKVMNQDTALISLLDHDLEDRLFLEITHNNKTIVSCKEEDGTEKPQDNATNTPTLALIEHNKPEIAPKPQSTLLQKDMQNLIDMIEVGEAALKDVIEKYITNPLDKIKFKKFYYQKEKDKDFFL